MPPSFASPAGSPSGSAAPGLTKVPSTLAPGGYSIIGYRSEVTFSPSEQRAGWSLWLHGDAVSLFALRLLGRDCVSGNQVGVIGGWGSLLAQP